MTSNHDDRSMNLQGIHFDHEDVETSKSKIEVLHSARSSIKDNAPSSRNENSTNPGSKEATPPTTTTADPAHEKQDGRFAVAKEDYSVFTVPQKRMIIMTGSLASWFR